MGHDKIPLRNIKELNNKKIYCSELNVVKILIIPKLIYALYAISNHIYRKFLM